MGWNLYFKTSCIAGTNIEKAVEEAIRISKKVDAYIELSFNGCNLLIGGTDTIARKVEEYQERLKYTGK